LFTYGKQRWEEISCSHKYNSLTLNLIVCQKRTLNPERISLQKRKAQHRRKRIQRKNYAKKKMQRARLTAGFFISQLFKTICETSSPRSPESPKQIIKYGSYASFATKHRLIRAVKSASITVPVICCMTSTQYQQRQ